jgi:hypothetical protein
MKRTITCFAAALTIFAGSSVLASPASARTLGCSMDQLRALAGAASGYCGGGSATITNIQCSDDEISGDVTCN